MPGEATECEVTFRLPFGPSVNRYWRHAILPTGGRMSVRVLISKEGRKYRDDVVRLIRERYGVLTPLRCRLSVTIRLCPPDRMARDIDNYQKATLDALTHAGVWVDDRQIDRLVIERGPVVPGGHADVTIRALPDPQQQLFDEPAAEPEEERPW